MPRVSEVHEKAGGDGILRELGETQTGELITYLILGCLIEEEIGRCNWLGK